MSHQGDCDSPDIMRNAVIAVFFFRALQAAGYFEGAMQRKRKGDRRLR
jgi:hypothetical protein